MWRRALIKTIAACPSYRYASAAAVTPSLLARSFASDADAAVKRSEDEMALPPDDHHQDHFQPDIEESKPFDMSEQFSLGSQEGQDTLFSEHVEEDQTYQIDVEKLDNVLALLQSRTDGSFESSLDEMELVLHEDFVVKVLETPTVVGENLIRFFKWTMTKSDVVITTCAVDALAVAICRSIRKSEAYMLWDLIRDISDTKNDVLNAEILNRLIALFSKLGKGKAAFEVFEKFGDFSCTPDSDTYCYTIEALCKRSMFDWACSVCEEMLNNGSLPNAEKIGHIITLLCKGAQVDRAHAVYMMAKEKAKYPSQSAVNFLISSLCKKDETVKLALEILSDFPIEARRYKIKPFSTVVRSLCRIKEVDEAKKLLLKMVAEGPSPGNAVLNSVVHGYSKSGDMNEAIEIMKLMESRGLKPDVYTYTVIISGYVSGGQMAEAHMILSEAKKQHSKLSPVTYHTLIRGHCKLEQFDEALKLLAEMKDFGVQPTEDEYNKLIQSLCLKALDWETAEELSKKMQDDGLHLNGITRGLIKAVKELEKESMKEELTA